MIESDATHSSQTFMASVLSSVPGLGRATAEGGCATTHLPHRDLANNSLRHMRHRHMPCAKQCCLVVQHHPHRNLLKHRPQTAFIVKSLHEAPLFQFGQDLRSDASANVDST